MPGVSSTSLLCANSCGSAAASAVEHVLGGLEPRREAGEFAVDLAQILGDLSNPVVLRLNALQPHFADRLAGACDRARDVAQLPPQSRRGAFDFEHARALRQP